MGISGAALNEVRLGEAIMPLSQQLRLARFIMAATSFHARQVESHNGPPPNRWGPRRRK